MRMTLIALTWRLYGANVLTSDEAAVLAQLCKSAHEYDGWRCRITLAWLAHHSLRTVQELAELTQSLERKRLLLPLAATERAAFAPARRAARAPRWAINVEQMQTIFANTTEPLRTVEEGA